MAEAIIEIQVLRDELLNPTGIYYNLSGLKVRAWLGLYIDGVQVERFKTNNQGALIGTLNPIPSEYHDYLISMGGFKFTIRDFTIEAGSIAGIADIVEDTDNEGLPNVGYHEMELRYD